MKITSQILLVLTVLAIATPTLAANCPAAKTTAFAAWYDDGQTTSTLVASGSASVTSATVCKTLWALTAVTDGGCCLEANVQTVFSAKMAPHVTAWKGFITGLDAINKNFRGIARLLSVSSTVTADLTKLSTSTDAPTKALLGGLTDVQVGAILLTANTTQNKSLTDFKTNGKACFNSMMKIFGNAVCLGCGQKQMAVGATNPTTADGTFSITPASALVVYGACYDSWYFIDRTGIAVQVIAAINTARTATSPPSVVAPAKPYVVDASTDATVYASWEKCKDTAKTTTDCTAALVKALFENHVNIIKPIPRLTLTFTDDKFFANGTAEYNLANATANGTASTTAKRMLIEASVFTGTITVVDTTTLADSADLTTNTDGPTITDANGPVFSGIADLPDVAIYVTGNGTNNTNNTNNTNGNGTSTSSAFVTAFSTVAITMITMLNLN